MNEKFSDFLKNKRAFKLILGAGNQNLLEIKNLVAIYAKAGCKFFDVGADIGVINAVKTGIANSIQEKFINDYHICVSVGTNNDPHIKKCVVNQEICIGCGSCIAICPNSAIFQQNLKSQINENNFIGCLRCQKICPKNAISNYSVLKDLSKVLPDIIDLGIDCIEIHTNLKDKIDFEKKMSQINQIYSGFLSICINRKTKSDDDIIKFLKSILKNREDYRSEERRVGKEC